MSEFLSGVAVWCQIFAVGWLIYKARDAKARISSLEFINNIHGQINNAHLDRIMELESRIAALEGKELPRNSG